MERPHLVPRDRVRVEFRLPPAVAETAYRCARQWNVSLSEAGARLIESGYEKHAAATKSPELQRDSAEPNPSGSPAQVTASTERAVSSPQMK